MQILHNRKPETASDRNINNSQRDNIWVEYTVTLYNTLVNF